jgi:hypothetical protein
VITVRVEYGGMRAERTATSAEHAKQQLADMYARHGITASKRDAMRGTANATGARGPRPVHLSTTSSARQHARWVVRSVTENTRNRSTK